MVVQHIGLRIGYRASYGSLRITAPILPLLHPVVQHPNGSLCWTIMVEDGASGSQRLQPVYPLPGRSFSTYDQSLERHDSLRLRRSVQGCKMRRGDLEAVDWVTPEVILRCTSVNRPLP